MRGHTVARNTLWIGLDTTFGLVSTATISIAAARLLGPELLGPYNYALWAAGLASFLVSLGIPAATGRFASELVGRGQVGKALGIVRASLRFQAVFAALAVGVGSAAVFALAPEKHRVYSCLVILSLAPAALMGIFTAAINATEEAAANVWSSLVSTAVCLAGSLFTLVYSRSLVGLASALLVSRVLDCGLRAVAFRRVYARRWPDVVAEPPPAQVYKRLRRFSLGATLLSLLSAIVWDRSDILFVNLFWDGSEVAFFAVGANLAAQVLSVPQVFLNAAGMTMRVEQGRNPEGLGQYVGTTTLYLALLTLPLGWGLASLSPALVPALYGGTYAPAVAPLMIAGFFVLSKALLVHARDVLLMRERYRTLLLLAAGTVVVGVALDLWLIPLAGAKGAAFANGLYHSAAATAAWFIVARDLGVRLPLRRLARIALAAAGMAVAVLGVVLSLPGPISLIVGVPLGAVTYLCALRALQCLDAADAGRLAVLVAVVPVRLRAPFLHFVRRVSQS